MILYTSTRFLAAGGVKLSTGNATTGNNGYGMSVSVNGSGDYLQSGGMNITTAGLRPGNAVNGQNAQDPFGPYNQPWSSLGAPSEIEDGVFAIAFCNTADMDVPTWVSTTELDNGEETDWAGNVSGAVGLHTPNLTDDVFTLVVPTTSTLRQATQTRNGNSIVFHIPANSLAVYAINANLVTTTTINPSDTDAQASEKIIGNGYGLILKSAGTVGLYNIN